MSITPQPFSQKKEKKTVHTEEELKGSVFLAGGEKRGKGREKYKYHSKKVSRFFFFFLCALVTKKRGRKRLPSKYFLSLKVTYSFHLAHSQNNNNKTG